MALTMDPAFFTAWRKRMKLTQQELATKLIIDISTVKKWEAGRRRLPSYIGLLMAAIEANLKPVGQNAMIEYTTGTGE
jgi:DNA-binding transcriptional regulator YiaG